MSPVDPTLEVERALAARRGGGRRIVVGIDEVGRGALAGPVAVGACAIEVVDGVIAPLPEGVRDSKKLTARRREALVDPIRESARAGAVGWASAAEIDEIGIMPALTRAALRALEGLGLDGEVDAIVLDGDVDVLTPSLAAARRPAPLVHLQVAADRDCASVSAASILAKVARDALMVELDAQAPDFGWASNKGYGSAAHREAIDRLGAHEHHRRSWRLGSRPAASAVPAARPAPVPVPSAMPVAPDDAPAEVPSAPAAGVLWDDQWYPQDGKERR
ncbi:ribonuclease HII [Brachybacterium ginsengisoli]|uniref:Ribonuclease n=1 Tax=Brachybacterium ginsengisoli TaxID=1331682 RepID=A0A291GYV6_9MICO|nr:ribonuclease HII [Brachybacterium ginsengisoli]ATG55390.1 ribonuclease HII [Brachybacterium ginsengisoli]